MTTTLVFAGNEAAARQAAHEHGAAWNDVIYVSRPALLRGLRTRGIPRIFGQGAGTRPDSEEIAVLLARQDLISSVLAR